MRAPTVTQAEIKRAVKGVLEAGLELGRVEIEGGRIVIYGKGEKPQDEETPLAKWKRDNGSG